MKHIALNYIYLSKKHAGGKDQVGLNLLKGFYELGVTEHMSVICFDYSVDIIRKIAPNINIISIKSKLCNSELQRLLNICYVNTRIIPKIIKSNAIDVIYHLSCNNGLRKLKARSIVIPHDIKAVSHRNLPGLKIPFYKYVLYKIMYYMDFKHADNIIAISDVDKSEIGTYYSKFKKKIVRIYNPIDMVPYKGEERQIENYIIAINLQFHHKNIITLIKAFELISRKVNTKLILIGSVPKRVAYLKEYVENNNLGEYIEFTDFVNDDVRNNYLKHCRLYVNPTLYEGFGMTAVEAIISGIPTLISKIDTNYEVTQGLCEYYYPPEDKVSLAKAIDDVLSKKDDREENVRKSRILFDSYNYLHVAEQYLSLFLA